MADVSSGGGGGGSVRWQDEIDYMKMISIRVSFGQKEAKLKAKIAADRKQKMQMVHQMMQSANMVQAIQGVNSSNMVQANGASNFSETVAHCSIQVTETEPSMSLVSQEQA
ncbi:uncharacterized protein LOC110432031 isoform X3 [Sorghum bicolor]|uniref:Uncharacterized protein n=1 Tax=Sorghum bicolor TaxID=4558 RepID=A0A1B6QJG0_SORBI|nr:uncharacterized protein LOC110432031 isoform X3 [Sorghum bicolor]KXG38055.1 hypothetical protein SORBI_3001G172200 [Sorghum bicolor]|eukprot:XP_021307641.1 uncharacterized protein LOC110432031 isoform X3 [Sorghum bicolor]